MSLKFYLFFDKIFPSPPQTRPRVRGPTRDSPHSRDEDPLHRCDAFAEGAVELVVCTPGRKYLPSAPSQREKYMCVVYLMWPQTR